MLVNRLQSLWLHQYEVFFMPEQDAPRIFISYAREDRKKALELYDKLREQGFAPWIDSYDILPGQRWDSAIEQSLLRSDFILICLSKRAVDKNSYLNREIQTALDLWKEKTDSDIYLIPIRLEECSVPDSLANFQWLNLFDAGAWEQLFRALHIGIKRREATKRPIDLEEAYLKQTNSDEWSELIDNLSPQQIRRVARASQIEQDARRLERCTSVKHIGAVHQRLAASELEGPASALLRSFSRISQDVDAALQQESVYNQRLSLKGVEERLDVLLRELIRSSERYAIRFRPITRRWQQILTEYRQALAEEVERLQEIDNPFIIGIPLTEQQEIFVGRTSVGARIEQLLLDRRRPPLLLYGQRRMGKTSLLNNLGRLLPSSMIPFFVDLQGVVGAKDHAGLLSSIARNMIRSANQRENLAIPELPREVLVDDPFTRFNEWLDKVEHVVGKNTALLALDEFEALDTALSKGRFDETMVLGMLRHLIQHRPRFKVLLAGSHTLDELQRWATYLINVQVVHLSYLKEEEARHLIEHPIANFVLRYDREASRRVLDLTRGHPYLVQLLCTEIVALKNSQRPEVRRRVSLADVAAAASEALKSGSLFFADIERNQVDTAGQAVLRLVASQGESSIVSRATLMQQLPENLDSTLILLTNRELIEQVNGGFRFQVELIRRWFAPQEASNGPQHREKNRLLNRFRHWFR
jgi:hypothetical protein